MKDKHKLIVLITIAVVVGLAWAVLWVYFEAQIDKNMNVIETTDTVSDNDTVVDKPATDNEDDEEVEQTVPQNREIKIDDKIKVVITGNDYLPTEEEVPIEQTLTVEEITTARNVTSYGFSSGLWLLASENIYPVMSGDELAVCSCASENFLITVREWNPLENTVEALRENFLSEYAFTNYNFYGGLDIGRDADVVLDEGLNNWEELKPDWESDYTISDVGYQLVTDTKEETAYGDALYVLVWDGNRFVGHAFITCDRDRILDVRVEGDVMSLCWPYIIEATNDVIKLVK